MISVFFNCSSPYVGYTLKKADYAEEKMVPCGRREMGELCYKVFNSSGSYMVLSSFEGKRYFHSRQSRSEEYDEQGRRIYMNVAFVADGREDASVVNRIAAYVFFEEEAFYHRMAKMITLLDDGFAVNFAELKCFLDQCANGLEAHEKEAGAGNALSLFDRVYGGQDFVVLESTISYFNKQAGYDFHALKQFSLAEAQRYANALDICFAGERKDSGEGKDSGGGKAFEREKAFDRENVSSMDKVGNIRESSSPVERQKEKQIEALRTENQKLKADLETANRRISDLNRQIIHSHEPNTRTLAERLKDILIGIIGTAFAVLVIWLIWQFQKIF